MREEKNARKHWKVLSKDNPKTRGAAKKALDSIGAPAVPTLVRVLTGPDRHFSNGTSWHSKAYRVLDLMGERAFEPLRELSQTGDDAVRRVATELLRKLAAPAPDPGVVVLDYILGQMQTATGHDLAKAAKELAEFDGDKAVDFAIDRLRGPIPFMDRVTLVRTLASVADAGNAKAKNELARQVRNMKRLMTLDHGFEKSIRPGRIRPALQLEINRLGTLLQKGVKLSSAAEISRDGDQWIIDDGDRRYLLEEGEEVTVTTGLADEEVVLGHRFAVILPDDDPYLASIRNVLRDN